MDTVEAAGSSPAPALSRFPFVRKSILIAALVLAAAVSLLGGVRNALAPDRSQDFQWSGTRLVLRHIDPWQDFLEGDPAHAIYRVQIPNYLPLMYVLLAPLGYLPIERAAMAWAALNVLFGLASGILCGRFFGLNRTMCVVLVALLTISTPMRTTLGNGQQGLLVLFIWVLALCRVPRERNGFTVGFSFCKYSFAPPVFLFLLLRLGYRAALWSLLPALASLTIVYLWLGGSLSHPDGLVHMLFAPLQVANMGYFGEGGPNLMDALQWLLDRGGVAAPIAKPIVYGLPLAIAAALLFLFARRKSGVAWEMQIALLAVVSLALFKHLPYDGVVLLLPMACCLRHLSQTAARWGTALICYPWYGDKLLRALGVQTHWSFVVDLTILAAIGIAVSLLRASPDVAADSLAAATI